EGCPVLQIPDISYKVGSMYDYFKCCNSNNADKAVYNAFNEREKVRNLFKSGKIDGKELDFMVFNILIKMFEEFLMRTEISYFDLSKIYYIAGIVRGSLFISSCDSEKNKMEKNSKISSFLRLLIDNGSNKDDKFYVEGMKYGGVMAYCYYNKYFDIFDCLFYTSVVWVHFNEDYEAFDTFKNTLLDFLNDAKDKKRIKILQDKN
ncbi:MAG: hypothetical protein K6E24_00790, partial [bacterium]|nr:hypothetical protein [bacterium]